MTETTDQILAKRGGKYGDFAEICVDHRAILRILNRRLEENSVGALSEADAAVLAEVLEMVTLKLVRISNGDPLYKDNWQDIEGYAKLFSRWIDDEGHPLKASHDHKEKPLI